MLVTNAMLLLASLTNVEAPQLYYFTSDNCPACTRVQPVVDELVDQGVPVVRVDAHKQPEWTRRAKVTALPTFIVVRHGQETGRTTGVASFRELSQLYFASIRKVTSARDLQQNSGQPQPPTTPISVQPPASVRSAAKGEPRSLVDTQVNEQVRGQNPRLGLQAPKLGSLWNNITGRSKSIECAECEGACTCAKTADNSSSPPLRVPTEKPGPRPGAIALGSADSDNLMMTTQSRGTRPESDADRSCVDCAMSATVRLKIVDELGQSFGTGTIIDVHKDEALVLTCGHIFRDSDGKGTVLCDSFAEGARPGIKGKVISFDIRRDIGLISFRPGVPVTPVAVGGTAHRPRERDAVFAVGCNRGNDPTVIENNIIAVNRYHGPPNLVVGGRPVDGRSGGGLFDAKGALIGVCNAADPEFDEGLYAALGNVHAELDSVGLGFIYRQRQPSLALGSPIRGPKELAGSARTPDSRPKSPVRRRNCQSDFDASVRQTPTVATIPPIVARIRSLDNPDEQTELFIERPSQGLMDQLIREANQRGPHRQTQLQTRNDYSEGWRSLAPSEN